MKIKMLVPGFICLCSLFGLFFACFTQLFTNSTVDDDGRILFGSACALCLLGFGFMLTEALEEKNVADRIILDELDDDDDDDDEARMDSVIGESP